MLFRGLRREVERAVAKNIEASDSAISKSEEAGRVTADDAIETEELRRVASQVVRRLNSR